MSDKKFNLTQTGQQVQDILNSAKSTDQVLTEIQEAMENLPDGQAVSAQVALNTAAIQELDANKASNEEVDEKLEEYTKFDGYYETMGVGTASNLKGDHVTNGTFLYRKTGGSEEIVNGGAFMEKVMGNTAKFNQKSVNGDFSKGNDGLSNWTLRAGSVSVSNNIATITKTSESQNTNVFNTNVGFTNGHKYFISLEITYLASSTILYIGARAGIYNDSDDITGLGTTGKKEAIYNCTVSGKQDLSLYPVNSSSESNIPIASFKNVMVFDLTEMFGAGNEPSTVEEFESWLATNVGLQSYYPYNEGELIPVKMNGIKSVGFNQWDEEWEKGLISISTGQNINGGGVRSKNYCPCLPNTNYHGTRLNVSNLYPLYIFWYDANKNYIDASYIENTSTNMVSLSNAAFFKVRADNGDTYNHDICINLSDEARNGEYEPYWENVESVDVCQLQGKENGTGDLVTIFPDGMKRAGSVYDEIKVENGVVKAIKRVGSVDLGDLTWSAINLNRMKANVPNATTASNSVNMITPKYVAKAEVTNGYAWIDNGTIYIVDSSYSDAQTFKSAMDGVMLYYELATPIEYIIEDLVWPLGYRVDNDGTEEVLIPAKAAGDPDGTITSCAPTLGIRYDMEAVETLKNLPVNYMSMASVDQLLSEMSSAMNGVWTKTWDEQNHRYSFSFTPNAEPEPQPDSQEENG